MISKKRPKLWVKFKPDIGVEEDEIDIETIAPNFYFLGDQENPSLTSTYLSDTMYDGQTFVHAQYQPTTITANFYLRFKDWYGFRLAKHDIVRYFGRKGVYRIRTDTHRGMVRYVRTNTFDISPAETEAKYSLFSIGFTNYCGLGYSLGTSSNLKTYDSELWQMGMNLPNMEDIPYEFSDSDGLNTFKIYNPSDVVIDPYYQQSELKITMNVGVNSLVELDNLTTGDTYTVKTGNVSTNKIVIDGIETTINGVASTSATNYGVITLVQGWNQFRVTSSYKPVTSIAFDFPFVYLPS